MNRIRTHDYTEYPITNQCKITIWNDKTFSISLTEDTVDLKAVEVKKLHRVVSAYMVEFTSLTHYLTKQLKFYESLIKPKIFFLLPKETNNNK